MADAEPRSGYPTFEYDDEGLYPGDFNPVHAALLAFWSPALDLSGIGGPGGPAFVGVAHHGPHRRLKIVCQFHDAVFWLSPEGAEQAARSLRAEVISLQDCHAFAMSVAALLDEAAEDKRLADRATLAGVKA